MILLDTIIFDTISVIPDLDGGRAAGGVAGLSSNYYHYY